MENENIRVQRPRIIYSAKHMKMLKKYFGIEQNDDGVTIRNALNFKTDGQKQDLIRSVAVHLYKCPIIYEDVYIEPLPERP